MERNQGKKRKDFLPFPSPLSGSFLVKEILHVLYHRFIFFRNPPYPLLCLSASYNRIEAAQATFSELAVASGERVTDEASLDAALAAGIERARHALDEGAAAATLERWRAATVAAGHG